MEARVIDVNRLDVPATHALNGAGWNARVNGTSEEITFTDEHEQFSITVEDHGVVSLWYIGEGEGRDTDAVQSWKDANTSEVLPYREDGATLLGEVSQLTSLEQVLVVAELFARKPRMFLDRESNPELESGILPGGYQQSHAMFRGRWRRGEHYVETDLAVYIDGREEYEVSFYPKAQMDMWSADLKRITGEDSRESVVTGMAFNKEAIIGVLDVLMRYSELFGSGEP